jgi:hypothetical protein
MKKILLLPLLSLYLSVTAQTGGSAVRYPATGELVITEIMADPTPSRGLPEREYLEILNRTGDSLETGGIMIIAGSDTAFLSAGLTGPGERVILCSTGSRSDLQPYGRVMAVKSFPSLNDAGELIALRDPGGSLIHAVSYSPEFLGDGPRSGGGWSAELTDTDSPFHEPYAWSPSSDPSGGTPGRANSTVTGVPDTRCPRLLAAWPATPDTLAVLFDETVMIACAPAWLADGRPSGPAIPGDPADRTAMVPLTESLVEGRVITVTVPPEITDFAGNAPCITEFSTGLPVEPEAGEILFNELMPDPADGQSEYTELYNNSGKIFDLSQVYLAGGSTHLANAITSKHRQLLPGEYLALSTGSVVYGGIFPCADDAAVFRADRLPALPDDGSTLILYDKSLNIIDRMTYSPAMHMPFLSGTKGISLEKVSPSLPSDVTGNWRSASEACNWGSPGAPNSAMIAQPATEVGLTLSSVRISPDGDGFEDMLLVSLYPGGDENIITLTLLNDRGYPVRRLADRVAAGAGLTMVWDGLSDQGARLPAGLYIVIAEYYNQAGSSGRWKKVCAVLYR